VLPGDGPGGGRRANGVGREAHPQSVGTDGETQGWLEVECLAVQASRLTAEALALVDVPQPPRWFVPTGDAIDDVDFTGGNTLVEVAHDFAERNIVFAIATVTPTSAPNSTASA
jgi:hypothetical protein